MECISQNSTDNQRREGVPPSPEPECTARQLPLCHDSTFISRNHYSKPPNEAAVTRQDQTQIVDKI